MRRTWMTRKSWRAARLDTSAERPPALAVFRDLAGSAVSVEIVERVAPGAVAIENAHHGYPARPLLSPRLAERLTGALRMYVDQASPQATLFAGATAKQRREYS